MTKIEREKSIRDAYFMSTATSLSDVYGRFSEEKRKAWEKLEALADEYAKDCDFVGDVRVISHNSWVFTAGFLAIDGDGTPFIVYATPSKTTAFAC